MNQLTKENYPFSKFIEEKYYDKLLIGYQCDQEDGARYSGLNEWFNDQWIVEQVELCGGDVIQDMKEWNDMIMDECCHSDMDDGFCLDCGKDRCEELTEAAIARAEAAADDQWHDRNKR